MYVSVCLPVCSLVSLVCVYLHLLVSLLSLADGVVCVVRAVVVAVWSSDEDDAILRLRAGVPCFAVRKVSSDSNGFYRAVYLRLVELAVEGGAPDQLRALATTCVAADGAWRGLVGFAHITTRREWSVAGVASTGWAPTPHRGSVWSLTC